MDENYMQLQEENGDTYEPTSEEINEEAKCLGIPLSDVNYLWIAREALKVLIYIIQFKIDTSTSELDSLST